MPLLALEQLLKISLLFSSFQIATGAPVDNSANSTQSSAFVGYVSEPNVRGTTSLLLSCLLTLVLCVWSALHLNVPRQDESRIHSLFLNGRWIITGIYAPELVVFAAWRQWASARLLGKLVTKLSKEFKTRNQTAPPTISTFDTRQQSTISSTGKTLYNSTSFAGHRHKWTKTHDFFASTGGFAFEILPDNIRTGKHAEPFLPKTCPARITLTARGVAFLAKCNRLPDIPEKDILDKSKANSLAKAVVVIQASWMLTQTLGRLVVGLPVTLLEVNTVAHVACTFVMYILWWNKPLTPNEPLIIDGDWVEPLCAYMYMSSDLSGEVAKKESETIIKTIFASLNWYSAAPEIEMISLRLPKTEPEGTHEEVSETVSTTVTPALPSFQSTSTSTSCLNNHQMKRREKAIDTAFFERRPRIKGVDMEKVTVSSVTSRRWNLALKAIDDYPTILNEQTLFRHEDDTCVHFKAEELLTRHVHNWPSNDLIRNVGGLTVGMVLWMASFAYGAIHAAAWNNEFPTEAEKWLWRSSATYVGFCGGLWIILNYVAQAYRPLNEFWERWMDGKSNLCLNIVIGSLVLLCGLSFCFARFFIVVEAVISIRRLPAAVYVTPDWSQLYPHL